MTASRAKSALLMNDKPIHLRLPVDALDRTKRAAEAQDRSVSSFARILFLQALDRYEATRQQKSDHGCASN